MDPCGTHSDCVPGRVKDVRAVFCDVSKAFGLVWRKGLLCKLRAVAFLVAFYPGSVAILKS